MKDGQSAEETRAWYVKRTSRLFLIFLLMMVVIFVSAGRLSYWQGWVYAGASLVLFLASAPLFINKPDLIKERQRPGPGVKWWDKVFFAFYAPLYIVVYLVGCLDAGRFGWSPHLPVFAYVLGYGVLFLSHSIVIWAMWTNRFFSSAVRIQTDRGHHVVQDGPYRFVRHPGYVGAIPTPVCISIVLGSVWALIPAGGLAILVIIRTYLEDRTLQRELPGYAEYAETVRYRLLPGIW
jgi:protein-S-isoprenylcysteine O-methyltransferase Ste14